MVNTVLLQKERKKKKEEIDEELIEQLVESFEDAKHGRIHRVA